MCGCLGGATLSLRLKDHLGPVTRVQKTKKKTWVARQEGHTKACEAAATDPIMSPPANPWSVNIVEKRHKFPREYC